MSLKSFQKMVEKIQEQIYSKKIRVSVSTIVVKISNSLLDFQSSIEKELEIYY